MSESIPQWFLVGMGRLALFFPGWPMSEGTVREFWVAMHQLTPIDFCRAVVLYARNQSAWPTPAGIMRYAKPPETPDCLAPEAWKELMRNRRRTPQSKKAVWPNEAVRRAAEAVDWDNPDWLTEQIPTIRAQFERYYTAIVKQQRECDEYSAVDQMLPAQFPELFRGQTEIGP